MKTGWIGIALILQAVFAGAQEIEWARVIGPGMQLTGLVCDNAGNVYQYGSRRGQALVIPGSTNQAFSPDTMGTVISKYAPDGTLLFSRDYKKGLYIKKIIYDGSSGFYFSGHFRGTFVIDGHTFKSRGQEDGVVGKMDPNANILWVRTYGGCKADAGNGLTFNLSMDRIVAVGGLGDSLYLNHALVSPGDKLTMSVLCFDLSGNLITHKQIDFIPEMNRPSFGKEIYADAGGNFVMLGDREGKQWHENTAYDDDGNYVFKLDPSFQISWSKYIINSGCYYGYACQGLCVGVTGDAFIPSYCSGKYGGSGSLKRLNSGSGNPDWSYQVSDGYHTDTYSDRQHIYLIGREGANDCPCEYHHDGYQVIKKLDMNNQVVGETRIVNCRLNNIVKNNFGRIYVTGYFHNNIQIGEDSLDRSKGHCFLLALNDINCQPVKVNGLSQLPYTYYRCPFDTLALEAEDGFLSYEWQDGTPGRKYIVQKSGQYRVKVTQSSGCVAYSLPVRAEFHYPDSPDLLNITYDNERKENQVSGLIFNYKYVSHKVYRKVNGNLQLFDTVANNEKFYFRYDSFPENEGGSISYYVSGIDNCGTESDLKGPYTPVYLRQKDNGTAAVITWNAFEGFEFEKYYILKGDIYKKQITIDSTDKDTRVYVVPPGIDSAYYKIAMKKDGMYFSGSNVIFVKKPAAVASSIADLSSSRTFEIYPNPVTDQVYFDIGFTENAEKIRWKLTDLSGRIVAGGNFTGNGGKVSSAIDVSYLDEGIYLAVVTDGKHSAVRRLIKE